MSEEMREESRAPRNDTATAGEGTEHIESHAASASAEPENQETKGSDASSTKLEEAVIAVLKTVYDPEIPVDIYELGLIYSLEVDPEGAVSIRMTLTTPMCPVAEILPPEVEAKARAVEGVKSVDLQLVWDPPWTVDHMSEAARLELNL